MTIAEALNYLSYSGDCRMLVIRDRSAHVWTWAAGFAVVRVRRKRRESLEAMIIRLASRAKELNES